MCINSALQSYIELTDIFCKLCQVSNRKEFVTELEKLENILRKVNEFRLFPFEVDLKIILELKRGCWKWKKERDELCCQLYVAIATLMYRVEASNVHNRLYFDYMLELGRTSLPYEVTNEWGKEYVQDMHFSQEGFFFALNRETRFLHNTKQEYNEYRRSLRKREVPNRPVEKVIPESLRKDLTSCYSNYYNSYCDSIEHLYPEIKELFRVYNLHMRIYLCSYNTIVDNPKIDFVLAYFYPSDKRKISVYPNYVDFAYRFFNIEEINENIISGCLSGYRNGKSVLNFVGLDSIHHEANLLFAQNARMESLRDYVCYFLRGRCKKVNVLDNGHLQYDSKTIVFCDEEISLSQIEDLFKSIHTPHFMFVAYPSESIMKFLKENDILWSCIFYYGKEMINNDNASMVHWFVRNNIDVLKKLRIDKGGNILEQKLANCKFGKLYWHDYELIGSEMFKFLFSDDFEDYQYEYQSSTKDGIQRRDLVVNNNFKDKTSFGARMHAQYHCNMLIVDFKNYTEAIDSDCVYGVTKYMTSCTGHFCLIFSRQGANESARTEQIRMLREGKLVLCLSDRDLLEMIQRKQSGRSPYCVLDKLLFTLMQDV